MSFRLFPWFLACTTLGLLLGGCPSTSGDDDDDADPCPPAETPQVDIIYPSDTAQFQPGETINFTASVGDDVDAPGDLDLTWIDDLYGVETEFAAPAPNGDGVITFTKNDFVVGIHIVTLEATDSDGCMGYDNVPFEILDPGN